MRKKAIGICREVMNGDIYKLYSDKRNSKSISCIGGNQIKFIVGIGFDNIVPTVDQLNNKLKEIGLKASYGESTSLHTCYQFIRVERIEKPMDEIEVFCDSCDGEFVLSEFYKSGSSLTVDMKVLDCPNCGNKIDPCELCFYRQGLESDHKCWRENCLIK